MEQKRVVLGEIPLNVVAGLVHPEAIVERRRIDALAQLRRDRLAKGVPRPQERNEDEVGAVVAVLDGRQSAGDHRVGLLAAAPGGEPRKRTHRVALGVSGNLVQRLGDTIGKRCRRRALPVGVADLDAEDTARDEAALRQRNLEVAEVRRQVVGNGDRQAGRAGLQLQCKRSRLLDRHEVAFDGDLHVQRRPAQEHP